MSYLLSQCRFPACFPSLTPPVRISNRSAKINNIPLALCLSSRLSSISMSQFTSDSPNDATKADDNNNGDILVQYVVLRRDLIDAWPLGSVVTQGCHASVSAIWSHKDDPHTLQYCSPQNINSMHKVYFIFYQKHYHHQLLLIIMTFKMIKIWRITESWGFRLPLRWREKPRLWICRRSSMLVALLISSGLSNLKTYLPASLLSRTPSLRCLWFSRNWNFASDDILSQFANPYLGILYVWIIFNFDA